MIEEAFINTYARIGASALTWPIEKTKLLYQGSSTTPTSANSASITGRQSCNMIINRLIQLPIQQHMMGIVSSGLQRGGSAFFMFYTQSQILQYTNQVTPSPVLDQAIAGGVSGAITAPFHTYWELIKVRGTMPSFGAYRTCLYPMLFRHAIFDATFFGVNTAVGTDTTHAGVRFALAAASASFMNLIWDVWKTRQMEYYPKRVWLAQGVLASMTMRSLLSNYLVKGTDLTANWFAVGCFKEIFFPPPKRS